MDRIFDNRRKNANRVAAAEYEYEYDYDHDNDYDTDLDTENRNRSDSQYYLCVSASWREPKYSVTFTRDILLPHAPRMWGG